MANICCDDVIFYTEGNPEGLYDLWEDLETHIILNQNPDLCWIDCDVSWHRVVCGKTLLADGTWQRERNLDDRTADRRDAGGT